MLVSDLFEAIITSEHGDEIERRWLGALPKRPTTYNRHVSVEDHRKDAPASVRCAIVTISDTRTDATDASGDAIAMYTYGGDANLDGAITGDDYFQIDSGFPAGAHGWFNGDFNYDGTITGDDYFIIDSNFPAQGAAFPTSGGGLAGVAAVPEPASIGAVVALGGLGLLRRGRRRLG